MDASRRDLVRSIFKNLVATLQAEILAIKQLWGSPKYVSKNRYSRHLGTLLYKCASPSLILEKLDSPIDFIDADFPGCAERGGEQRKRERVERGGATKE